MKVFLTDHCIERYHERVRESAPRNVVARELQSLIHQGTLEATVPWSSEPADAYLVISDGVALTLKRERAHWIAVTAIARGGVPESVIEKRRKEKRERRRRRAAKRNHYRDHRPEAA